ncbi:hypothetical protein [Pararhodobacter marinus]|nr:hypothetical protein [Pararhodobacter marinus]
MPTDITNEELERRIEELKQSGMTLAAKALQREQSFRERKAAA